MRNVRGWVYAISVFAAMTAAAVAGAGDMPDSFVPASEMADAVMAAPAEVQEMLDWSGAAFAGVAREGAVPRVALEVVRQDHNVLGFGESCMETPIVIGSQTFAHGLGTHANSEIAVTLPSGAKAFEAAVGIDNNFDTGGTRGSVVFSVEVDGQEAFRSPVLTGADEAVPVHVDLPDGASKLLLKVDTTDDGPGHDQADWADARLVMQDGSTRWLDENQSGMLFLNTAVPFSFSYGGEPSGNFLGTWEKRIETRQEADRVVDVVTWTDPETQLVVSATVSTFTQYPAVDWVIEFENGGTQDTPIIEDIQALDTTLRTGYMRRPAMLHELEGDACGESTFLPKATAIEAGRGVRRAPTGGRPSSISAFPWWNIAYRDRGIITAVGWTGQWASQFDRMDTGPLRMRAGMEQTHLLLHPGESIRTPRVVMMAWQGDRVAAHNRWRRLVLYHYVPRLDGKPLQLPVALQTFDRYHLDPAWACEAGQLNAVNVAKDLGCDTYWLDAAWFLGHFPNGVGNWFCKPDVFPNGLKAVGDACREAGMRFVLWFEPERVAPGTQIATEHPDYVFGGANGGLFKLNDPAARRWLTDLLSQRIDEYGITVYRNDFNIDPLSFWRGNDAPDRQGMTEIRYVEGLYAMWDELRERHPGLWIDNCSSGGRRIDIEMCMRSVPLWRSDTNCSAGHPDWNQAQSAALGLYVPLTTACVWAPTAYEARSAATGGLLCQFAYREEGFPMEKARALVAEAKINRAYWYGDFYPLTPCRTAPDEFVAYQLHRPDLDSGLVVAFRRAECNYVGLILELNAIKPGAMYQVETVDEDGMAVTRTMSSDELAQGIELRIPEKQSSLIVRYTLQK